MPARRPIQLLVIHCTATPNGASLFSRDPDRTPLEAIDAMHAARGFSRTAEWRAKQNGALRAIGYHFVLYVDGTVATGRAIEEVGAHVKDWNAYSLGLALIGTDAFTRLQWTRLAELVEKLCTQYRIPPRAVSSTQGRRAALMGVAGHRDLSDDLDKDGTIERQEWIKTCPGFSVADWMSGGMQPLAGHIAPDPATRSRAR
jgi:N-acetyl-anhydromuramyl-L-alanine amidase AmpD